MNTDKSKNSKKAKRLSKKDFADMWGDEGPYSEVRLVEQARLLDDSISRVFIVAEASINPFTFNYVLKHRHKFSEDESIQDLLNHADYRGYPDGYIVCAGQEELIDKKSFERVSMYREILIKEVLKMHEFVIKEFGLRKDFSNNSSKKQLLHKSNKNNLIIKDNSEAEMQNATYIWNEKKGVVPVKETIWNDKTAVSSPAGSKNGKFRYYIVFILATKISFNKEETIFFCEQLQAISTKFEVEIEDVTGEMGYMMLTALISPDIAPLDFIDETINAVNKYRKMPLFLREHFVTNVEKPSFHEIEGLLRRYKKDK